MPHAAPAIKYADSTFGHGGDIAIDWFELNGMQANPIKFNPIIICLPPRQNSYL